MGRSRWSLPLVGLTFAALFTLSVGGTPTSEEVPTPPERHAPPSEITDVGPLPAGVGGTRAVGPASRAPGGEVDHPTSPIDRVAVMGSGRFDIAGGAHERYGEGRTWTYLVEVEEGIGITAAAFAVEVESILLDPRSWTGGGRVTFERRSDGPVDIRVTLATPGTVDEECAPLETVGRYSCWNGERAMINLDRWLEGSSTYAGDLHGYRRYLINHEVGHGLGRGHVGCPTPGLPAPVMMQQTIRVDGCVPSPWPHPDAVEGARRDPAAAGWRGR